LNLLLAEQQNVENLLRVPNLPLVSQQEYILENIERIKLITQKMEQIKSLMVQKNGFQMCAENRAKVDLQIKSQDHIERGTNNI
jgi:hypothetical protein